MKLLKLFVLMMVAGCALITTESIAEESSHIRQAVFAGGCFWCMQPPFDQAEGVLGTEVGYTGGHTPSPDYAQVSRGDTGHVEAIRVLYDETRITYSKLLGIYWRNVDPTQADGQFVDRGPQYRTVVFYDGDMERKQAEASKALLQQKFKDPIVVELRPVVTFYPAEGYHQGYYKKNPLRYRQYKKGSGREAYLNKQGEH